MRRSGLCAGVVSILLLAAGCNQLSPEEKAANEARDIAAVKAANDQLPPLKPLSPQAILFPDIRKANLYGPGCAFVAKGGGLGAIAMTQEKRAAIKLADELVILASDPGSTEMPFGTWSHYVGKRHSLTLTRLDAAQTDPEWRGKLVITDTGDRVVFEAEGLVQCKAGQR